MRPSGTGGEPSRGCRSRAGAGVACEWVRGLLRPSVAPREGTRTPHGCVSKCFSLLQLPPGPPAWPPPMLTRLLSLGDPGLKYPAQPQFPEISAARSRAAGAGTAGPCARRHPGRGLASSLGSPVPSFRLARASPRPAASPRRRRSSFAPVFRGEKGQKGQSLCRPFLRKGGVFPSGPRTCKWGSAAADLREARRTESSRTPHMRRVKPPPLARARPGPVREPQGRLGHPCQPSIPPPLLPTAHPSAQVPRPARRSRSPRRAVCTHRDFREAGSARASPGRVPGGRDAEARL